MEVDIKFYHKYTTKDYLIEMFIEIVLVFFCIFIFIHKGDEIIFNLISFLLA